MARVKVRITDVGKDFALVQMKEIKADSEIDTRKLAERCETVIRTTIDNKTAGGTGKLSGSKGWDAEPIPGGWGVGDIAFLDADCCYWNHQDKGSEGIGANWQHFLPKGLWVNGRWVQSSSGFSGIQPQTPIPALNYIDTALQIMQIEIPKILKDNG